MKNALNLFVNNALECEVHPFASVEYGETYLYPRNKDKDT